MRLGGDVIIAREKIERYLLVPRATDDKAVFLARAGFTSANSSELETAIRWLVLAADAVEDGRNEYGVFWRVEGRLKGPLSDLDVILIFIDREIDHKMSFVTLKPLRRSRS